MPGPAPGPRARGAGPGSSAAAPPQQGAPETGADADHVLRLLLGGAATSENGLDAATLQQVLPLLRHPEPIFRELTLRALSLAPRKLRVLARETGQDAALADVLLDITSADERLENRALAGLVLGRVIPSLDPGALRDRLETGACAAVCALFRSAFDRQSLRHAIAAATAIAPYLELVARREGFDSFNIRTFTRETRKVMAGVFPAGADKTVNSASRESELQHPLLAAALLRALREHLHDTSANRRVFIEPIRDFVHEIFVVRRGPTWRNRQLPDVLRDEASWFLCRWFQLPSDDFVLKLDPRVVRALARRAAGLAPGTETREARDANSDVPDLLLRARARLANPKASWRRRQKEANTMRFTARSGYVPRRHAALLERRAKPQSDEEASSRLRSMQGSSQALASTQDFDARAVAPGKKADFVLGRNTESASGSAGLGPTTSCSYAASHPGENGHSDSAGGDQNAVVRGNDEEAEEEEDDDEHVEIPADLRSGLSFQIAHAAVELSGPQGETILHLTNPGAKSEFFSLQAYPSEHFLATPAHGVVEPKTSLPIRVRFVQDFSDRALAGARAKGFIRVRSRLGMPGERIALSACHGPLLEVQDTQLHFGHVTGTSASRSLPIIVRNRAKVPCNVTVGAVDDQDAIFVVRQSQALVAPGDELWVDVSFRPRESKGYKDTILISGPAGEVHSVQVHGHGGTPLKVYEDELEYGSLQLSMAHGASAVKTIRVENLDMTQPLPLNISSDRPSEVFVEAVTLQPREVRELPVRIRSFYPGTFEAKVCLGAPGCPSWTVSLQAFVGNLVGMPLAQTINFPVQATGSHATFELPLKNFSAGSVEFYLTGFQDTPCAAWFQSPTQEAVEMREGNTVVMHPFEDVMLELRFTSLKPGLFRLPVRLELVHPHRVTFGPWYVTIPCTGEDLSGDQRRLKSQRLTMANLRRLLAVSLSHEHPAAGHPLGDEDDDDEDDDDIEENMHADNAEDHASPADLGSAPDQAPGTESHLQIAHQITPVFGNPSAATVEVRNSSNVSQAYKILITSPFVLRQPRFLEGYIDPHDVVRLDVEIDPSLKDASRTSTWGFLSVLQERDGHLRPMCATLLQGAETAPAYVRCPDDGLVFRDVHRDEVAFRMLRLSNQTPHLLRLSSAILQEADASPFRLAVDDEAGDRPGAFVMETKLYLRPWDQRCLAIRFKVQNAGVYAAPIRCTVQDPFASDQVEAASGPAEIKVFAGMLDGAAHSVESVASSPSVVDFGNLSVGRVLRQSALLTNYFRQELAVALAVDEGPFRVTVNNRAALVAMLPSAAQDASNRVPVDISVRPDAARSYVRFCKLMPLSGTEEPKCIVLRVRAGHGKLTSNFGDPSRVWTFPADNLEPTLEAESTTCVDFGTISTTTVVPARLELTLRNAGSKAVKVTGIHSRLAQLRWTVETFPGHAVEQDSAVGVGPSQLERMRYLAAVEALVTQDSETAARRRALSRGARTDVPTTLDENAATVDWDEVDFHIAAVQQAVSRSLRAKAVQNLEAGLSNASDEPSLLSGRNSTERRTSALDHPLEHPVLEEEDADAEENADDDDDVGSEERAHFCEDDGSASSAQHGERVQETDDGLRKVLAEYAVSHVDRIVLPLTLEPGKEIRTSLEMTYEAGAAGVAEGDLEVHTDEPGAAAPSIHVFRVSTKFQPALTIDLSEVSFGVVAAGGVGTGFVTIRNPGVVSVHWRSIFRRTDSVLLEAPATANAAIDASSRSLALSGGAAAEEVFSCTPAECSLDAGRSQRVKLVFKPTHALLNCELKTNLIFKTSLMEASAPGAPFQQDEIPVALRGETGSAAVIAELPSALAAETSGASPSCGPLSLSFGCIQVGMRKSIDFRLRNFGNLPADFVVERDPGKTGPEGSPAGNLFTFAPALGSVGPGQARNVTVTYQAAHQGAHDVALNVLWSTHNPDAGGASDHCSLSAQTIKVGCEGSGGMPQLHVRQARIKYEQAIVGVANTSDLEVHNYGTAECFVVFKMPNKSLHVDHGPDGVRIPPRGSVQIPVILTPTSLERVETTIIVQMTQDASVFYEVDVSAFVGVPDLSVTPERALQELDFDVALVKQTHLRSFTVTNIGDVGLDFRCVFLRPTQAAVERRMRRASTLSAPRGRKQTQRAKGGLDKAQRESWLDNFAFPGDYEEFVPDCINVEPMEGVFETGLMIHFTVTYEPLEREKESHAIFAIRNRFETITAEIRGVGGDPLLELDTPLRVIDFGLCEADKAYERTIHVMNPGNVPYDFVVEPDPTDAELRAALLQLAEVGGADPGGPHGTRKRRKSLVRGADELTVHLPRALARLGFALETSGTCDAYGRSPIRFSFKLPEDQESNSTRIFVAKVHLRHATGYEKLTLRAKEACACLGLYDTDQTPVIDDVLDFGISAVRRSHFRTVLLHNTGKLPSVFYVQSNTPREYGISPQSGTVGPGEFMPLQISFSPSHSDRVEGVFSVVYNSAKRLPIAVAGIGGQGLLEAEFLSDRDRNMQGLDFQLVSTHVLMEKKLLLHNAGQVPLRLVCESTSPYYTLGSIKVADVQCATPGYSSKFSLLDGEAERLGAQGALAIPHPSAPMVVARKPRQGQAQATSPTGRSSVARQAAAYSVQRQQSRVALDTFSRAGDDANGHSVVESMLIPGHFAVLRVRLCAEREITYSGLLKVRSEFNALSIPLRARGGGVKLRHSGSLDFGQIACDHTYARTITLSNVGSIPSSVEIYWRMKSGSREAFALGKLCSRPATVLLKGSTTRLGLRRFWHWAIENVLSLVREARALNGNRELSPDQRLALVDPDADLEACLGVRISDRAKSVARISAGTAANKRSRAAAAGAASGLGNAFQGLREAGDHVGARVGQILDRFHKYQETQLAKQQSDARDLSEVVRSKQDADRDSRALYEFINATNSRRRERLGNNNNNDDVVEDEDPQHQFERELEDSKFTLPHVRATPQQGTLSERISMDVTVSLNSSIEGKFAATLVVAPTLPGVESYEIPVTAETQEVRIIIDDTSTINFGRQALGETKVIRRVFENQGSMAAEFRIRNNNEDLAAEPSEGTLQPGDVLAVDFVYSPSSESLCVHPIVFETNCTAPIVIDVYAGGGYPQLDLDHYESFDFGRCMVGKTIPKRLRIGNSGNAMLTVTALRFRKANQRGHAVFKRGEGWPRELDSGQVLRIAPSESFYVPLVFHPHAENHFEDLFTIQTTVGSYTLRLAGSGREAVLSLSVHRVDFVDCIIGNAYRTSFEVSNAGDLTYPLDISLLCSEGNEPVAQSWTVLNDLKVDPQHLAIAPFEKRVVTVMYLPTRPVEETTDDVRIALSSIYSNFDLPLRLIAGTANLVMSPTVFDFGHFQVSKPATATVTFTNTGTMGFGLRIKRAVDPYLEPDQEAQPFPFKLSRWEARLPPGESVEIVASFVRKGSDSDQDQEKLLGAFHEELHVETDLVGSLSVLVLKGKCDASTLRPAEFDQVNLGPCAVGDLVTKIVTIRNYGGYPAELSLRPSFPLKVTPKTLTVAGHAAESFSVSWKPMGGYELRGSIKALTNAGVFDIQVHGVGVYPKFYIEGGKIDFGICAPGVEYGRHFAIRNMGKIDLEWTVPAVAPGFRVSPSEGTLGPRQAQDVAVNFKPVDLGRFPGDFIVESKGRYKIVSASGVGGTYDVRVDPETRVIDFGETPCGTYTVRHFNLLNRGSVPAALRIHAQARSQPQHARVALAVAEAPGGGRAADMPRDSENRLDVVLQSGQAARVAVGVHPGARPEPFSFDIRVESLERTETIIVGGTGHIITLSDASRALLRGERLACLDRADPVHGALSKEASVERVLAPADVDDFADWRALCIRHLEPVDVPRGFPRIDEILAAPPALLDP